MRMSGSLRVCRNSSATSVWAGGDGPGDWGDGSPTGLVPGVSSLNQGKNKVPAEKWCPFNFFRTSGDISGSWGSMFRNLQTVDKHQPWNGTADEVKTGPGCWAYPCAPFPPSPSS